MGRCKDLAGMKFHALTVLEKTEKRDSSGNVYWLCKCDCGNNTLVKSNSLISGHTKGCGCHITNMKGKYKRKTRLGNTWQCMKQRCLNHKDKRYNKYGGRGITICDEWLDYDNFYEWAMANGYQDDLSIERIDVNGNYEPSNCTWITMRKQMDNTTRTVRHNINGKMMTVREIADELGVSYRAVEHRIKRGQSLEGKYRGYDGIKTLSK